MLGPDRTGGLDATAADAPGSEGRKRVWPLLPAVLVALTACLRLAPAQAQTMALPLGGTDGNVAASVRYGNTLYIGGFFTQAGPITGSCVAVDSRTGALLAGFPEFTGPVRSVVADGRGGWFIGGEFTAVGGAPHGRLAHVDRRFRLTAWDPAPDGAVVALAIKGDTLFVGGRFTRIGGIDRPHLTAFGIAGGELLDPMPAPNGSVRCLLVTENRLFLGGDFDSVDGVPRRGLAALDVRQGRLESWDAMLGLPDYPGWVQALAVFGDTLIAGGLWARPDLSLRCLAAASLATGALSGWDPRVTGPDNDYFIQPFVAAIVADESSVYVGGHFTEVSGSVRSGLAKIGFPSGAISSWNPDAGPWYAGAGEDVSALALHGGTLYAGGWFESLGESTRRFVAAVDPETGELPDWSLGANFGVVTLAARGDTLIVGGEFQGAGAEWNERRHGLAAFDLTTGSLKEWSPGLSGLGVECLAAANGNIYVGGYFEMLGGEPGS